MAMKYDYLIVWAWLTWLVLWERLTTQSWKKVLIIDRRKHIWWNCYDYKDESGVTVHKYWPHVFHTKYKEVRDYLSNFTKWEPFFYNVKAIIDSKEVSLPFNLNSIYQIFPPEFAKKLEWLLIDNYWYGKRLVVKELLDSWDKDLKFLWNFVFEKVFEWYTKKQWWLTSEEIDPSILSRVPVLISRDDSYFQDEYQAIPSKWYTEMMNNIIKSANLEIKLETDFKNLVWIDYDRLIYTWPIDEYFDYKFWKLPYRSLSFDFRKYNRGYFQSWPQINYPCNHDFTRIVEYKYYLKEQTNQTIVSYEYPQEYIQGENEPYYPIINDENIELYNKYLDYWKKNNSNVVFAWRLWQYKYFNMDQTVKNALDLFVNKLWN